jgi:hypothetical protein
MPHIRMAPHHTEQEDCSFDRRHLLAFGIQNEDSGRKSDTQYTLDITYINYITYLICIPYVNYTHYLNVRQDLGIADHVRQDKGADIAQSVDALGDQSRPAMRAGWLSYIRQAYPDDAAKAASPPVGEGMLVLPD